MTETAAELLRCPLDPARQSRLVREQQELICDCGVRFPVRQGVPILIAEQAKLPSKPDALPCRKKK